MKTKIEAIEKYQIFGERPYICKSESCNGLLEPKETKDNINLVCNTCGYSEKSHPVPVMKEKD